MTPKNADRNMDHRRALRRITPTAEECARYFRDATEPPPRPFSHLNERAARRERAERERREATATVLRELDGTGLAHAITIHRHPGPDAVDLGKQKLELYETLREMYPQHEFTLTQGRFPPGAW